MDIDEKVKLLRPREQLRLAKIMLAIAKLIDAMTDCDGPDDARIAQCVAITTVFGIQVVDRNMSQARLAEITLDFAIDALIARRKPDEHFQQTRRK